MVSESSPGVSSPSRTLEMLWRAVFWVSFPFGILSFVLPIYGKELGGSALQVGGFFTAVSLAPLVVRPLLGRALDRWGRRPFLLLGLAGYATATAVFCVANTVWLLTLARFIQGLGQAFLWISAYTIVADVTEGAGHGRDFGRIDEAVNRGALIGTSLGFGAVLLMSNWGLGWRRMWFWLFAAYAVPSSIALWTGWWGVGETKPAWMEDAGKGRPLSRQLAALMAIVLVTGGSRAMVWPMLMLFLQDGLGADVGALAIAYVPAALISSFLPSRTGRVADRLGRKGPMVVGLTVGALASVLIPHLPGVVHLAILWAVESLGYAIYIPAERAFVADVAGADVRGTSYGLYTFAYFLGAAIGPLAGGWLYDHVGHAVPFYVNTMVLLVGALLVLVMLHEPRTVAVDRLYPRPEI